VELLGAERLIYARLGTEQVIVRVEEGAPCPSRASLQVRPRADRLHRFDAASGKRLPTTA
jgi:sn-glycerol 3-phosphate transport system ATP-binding protein